MAFDQYWRKLQVFQESDEPQARILFGAYSLAIEDLSEFWQAHDGDLSDEDNEWIADQVERIWIARSIAYASTMRGSGTVGEEFGDSRTDFAHRLNPPSSIPRQPGISEMDWVVYWWCMYKFEDFQAEWNRLLDWTKRLYQTEH